MPGASMPQKFISQILRGSALLCALIGVLTMRASAEFSQYDTQTYDYFALGAPKFVNTDYIDTNRVTQISKFRSFIGHDYSDSSQFGTDTYRYPGSSAPVEYCRSMKHYFVPPDAFTEIRAPVSGVVSRVFEEELATQIHITSDDQPAFTFAIFHVVTPAKVEVGMRVTEGQVLGHHVGTQTFSDMAVMVHTPKGYHLISYFETMTDGLFAKYQARGIATREQMIISKETVDADPNRCTEFSSAPEGPGIVKLTGGAATQTIGYPLDFITFHHAGDTDTVKVTASSGLPVTIVSATPKVCAVQDLTIQYRRAGTCSLTFVQSGDANWFAASAYYYVTVAPAGSGFTSRPKIGAVFPPSATGSQSFLRFISGYNSGTVSLTLTDAATGNDKIRWTSPNIAAWTSPQYSIADIEATAPAGYQRPAMYGLRIEESTTLSGTLQHVLYHPADGTITNLTTCDSGLGTPAMSSGFYGNVHTSKLAGFPSTIIYHNTTAFGFTNVYINIADAVSGTRLGFYTIDVSKIPLDAPVMPLNSGTVLSVSSLEQTLKIAPNGNHYTMSMTSTPYGDFFQHLVTNTRAGVIADMTAVCNLGGGGVAAPGVPLRGGGLFGTTQAASQSFLRFFNAGATAGPVNLTLYDMATGTSLGQWTSSALAPGQEVQKQIGEIESALGVSPKDYYDFRIDTDIDGYFQHVLWRSTDGTLTNLSTCAAGVGADPYTMMGVHSSLVAAQGYQSVINVMNTGANAQTVKLTIADARDGSKIGTYTTPSIPAGGQLLLDAGAIEAAAKIAPNTAMFHYIIKADPFTGFLQHLVNNQRSGVITDMTTVCAM